MSLEELAQALKGGKGSGFHGHSGRKGKVGGSSGGGGGSVGSSSANVSKSSAQAKKPSKKKITIQQVSKLLTRKGYKLGEGKFDLKSKTTSYQVTDPKGNVKVMTSQEIYDLI